MIRYAFGKNDSIYIAVNDSKRSKTWGRKTNRRLIQRSDEITTQLRGASSVVSGVSIYKGKWNITKFLKHQWKCIKIERQMYISAVLPSRNIVCNWKECFHKPLRSGGIPGCLSLPLPIPPREKVDSQQMIPKLPHREVCKCEARDELLTPIE